MVKCSECGSGLDSTDEFSIETDWKLDLEWNWVPVERKVVCRNCGHKISEEAIKKAGLHEQFFNEEVKRELKLWWWLDGEE